MIYFFECGHCNKLFNSEEAQGVIIKTQDPFEPDEDGFICPHCNKVDIGDNLEYTLAEIMEKLNGEEI